MTKQNTEHQRQNQPHNAVEGSIALHPHRDDIRQVRNVLKLVDLGQIISDAAYGEGDQPPVHKQERWHSGVIRDTSGGAPVLVDSFRRPVLEAHQDAAILSRTVESPGGGRSVARSEHNVVGGVYNLANYKLASVPGPDSTKRTVRVNYVSLPEGSLLDIPDKSIMHYSQGAYRKEPLSSDAELDMKYRIAEDFGLRYEVATRDLPERSRDTTGVSDDTKGFVRNLIRGLQAEGLTGESLERAVLKKLHPDDKQHGDNIIDWEEAFKYARALNYNPKYSVSVALAKPSKGQ